MTRINIQLLARQLDEILSSYKELLARSQYDDLSDIHTPDLQRIITQSQAAVIRISGMTSPYTQQVEHIVGRSDWDGYKVRSLIGVVEALKHDLEAGYMQTTEELIHGELFSDFLEMASHLLDEGYKDPAAVVGGAALEGHLRQLAKKINIETMTTVESNIKPKKAESLNSEIVKAAGYSVLDQKNITAWLDLRNKAAHGHYDAYTSQQVAIMLAGIRDFITRNPA
jgi:hypothetical protein